MSGSLRMCPRIQNRQVPRHTLEPAETDRRFILIGARVAITGLEYIVFSSLRGHGLLPAKPRVLELGESNWYGDVPTEQLARDLRGFVTDVAEGDDLVAKLRDAVTAKRPDQLYEIARIFWRAFVDPASFDAIDPGTAG